jgi:NAD(P)H dehydrogenase (quinone)
MDTGGLKGRRAMLTISTGCYPEMVEPDGLLGALEVNLWHLNSGTLAYVGLEVLPPFMSWSIHYTTPEQRDVYLNRYEELLGNLDRVRPMFFHPLADFGSNWRLKPEVTPATVAHSRPSARKNSSA